MFALHAVIIAGRQPHLASFRSFQPEVIAAWWLILYANELKFLIN
jgi:hypothetical protein